MEHDTSSPATPAESQPTAQKPVKVKKVPVPTTRSRTASKNKLSSKNASRKRTMRPYPASSFREALPLAEAIHKYASGERVRRLTLLKQLDKSPNSGITKMLITNSTRYGLTKGSYIAEWLELTELGTIASNPDSSPRSRLEAQFKLAIEGIPPFQRIYSEYRGKRLPTHDVLKDVLADGEFEIDKPQECVDLFIVNVKDLGLLQTIAGSEMLLPIEQVLDELGQKGEATVVAMEGKELEGVGIPAVQAMPPKSAPAKVDWSKTCFIITPIGEEGSDARKHSDLFLNALIVPALREFGLEAVRADQIGVAGMITSQILEYVIRSRLAIADLSFHNPNAFYEMAIRHACGFPIVQISRKQDRLPFDVNQVRTVVIDTTDIYTLVPKLETYRSEIATQVRAALSESSTTSNPISVFFPGFSVNLPKEK